MTSQPQLKTMNIVLWFAQILLSATFLWAASVKLFQPVADIAAMWPWAGQVSIIFLKFTGIVDFFGAIGLIVPAMLRVRPILTPVTAILIIVQMICASAFHIIRGEGSNIGANILFAVIAAFIAWGRLKKAPIFPN